MAYPNPKKRSSSVLAKMCGMPHASRSISTRLRTAARRVPVGLAALAFASALHQRSNSSREIAAAAQTDSMHSPPPRRRSLSAELRPMASLHVTKQIGRGFDNHLARLVAHAGRDGCSVGPAILLLIDPRAEGKPLELLEVAPGRDVGDARVAIARHQRTGNPAGGLDAPGESREHLAG